MAELAETLTGARKAALLLMSMGEDFTSEVFKHLNDVEIKAVGEHMAKIKKVDPKLAVTVMEEFAQISEGIRMIGTSGRNFLERSVTKAFDPRKADNLLEDLFSNRGAGSFRDLDSMSPQILANILVNEHPQTIALILVNMKYQTAAEIIQRLPEQIQSEVITRIADLEDVPKEIVSEVKDAIEEQISKVSKASDENLGGIQTAAEILNHIDQKTENAILERIETDREDLAEEIRQSMFVFEDLLSLDDRSIRALLKEISNDELILALKTASEDLGEKIFSNVSQRAAEMMKEDMEVMGPVRLRDVEQAQLNIIKTARRLAEEGKIVLGGKGGEDVLV
ncbi:MAG: flagellar motor switch protein FliG [Deltaproteobacteria bacterium]|nr:flagellar motor switch protein FliG [Deltaproteobacteria bacterium]